MPGPLVSAASRRRPLAIVGAIVLVAGVVAVLLLLLLSGEETHTPAELALQRSQLALVSRQLLQVEAPVAREVAHARMAWPSLAEGLPARASSALGRRVAAANGAAEAVPTPPFLEVRHELIGPAERISTLFHNFEVLAQHGWAHLDQAVGAMQHGSRQVAAFERANSGLYIDSIHDGHLAISEIGEKVLHSYERLGAGAAFGASLTPRQVSSIVAAFSPQADQLSPRHWRELPPQD